MHGILTAIAEANLPIEVKNQLLGVLGINDLAKLDKAWESSGVEPLELLQDVLIVSEKREASRRES